MRFEPLRRLVDDAQGQQIAILRRIAPGEEAVAAQYDAHMAGAVACHLAELEPQIETRPLPRKIRWPTR